MRSSALLAALTLGATLTAAAPSAKGLAHLKNRDHDSGQPNGGGGSYPPPPMPYTPEGGLGTNSTPPEYIPLIDLDSQSVVCPIISSCPGQHRRLTPFLSFDVESCTEPGMDRT